VTSPRATPIEVLLVEDNPPDAELVVQALARAKIRNRVHVTTDGTEALDFLHGRGRHADAPGPDLVLLDLNLPGRDWRAVLEDIKGDERLRHIPVVVLTRSTSEHDIAESYRLHANAYVRKPLDPGEFLATLNSLEQFWLEIVRLP
jgi:CheY-like chemotaxis protein